MQILKSQLNKFYDILEDSGFNPSDFAVGTKQVSRRSAIDGSSISYKKDDYYFICGEMGGSFYLHYSPDESVLVNETQAFNWTLVESYFLNWLESLKTEIST